MKKSVLYLLFAVLSAAAGAGLAEVDGAMASDPKVQAAWLEAQRRAYRIRARRPTRPRSLRRVREENISDNEVREIEAIMHQHYPGAIVNISAVTNGCACADGPACDSQVWVVADRDRVSNGLVLSQIAGQWMIGPVQEWWLAYEDLQGRLREARRIRDREERARLYQELTEEQDLLERWSPYCTPKEYEEHRAANW